MFKKENHTLARINKKLLSHINQWLLLHQDMDERLITMAIVELKTSPDLSQCRAFIRHKDNPESLAQVLNKHHHPLHQYLFKHLDIRRIPKIKFMPQDPALTSVLDILDEIENQ